MKKRIFSAIFSLILVFGVFCWDAPEANAQSDPDTQLLITACKTLDPSVLDEANAEEKCLAIYDVATRALNDLLRYPDQYSDWQKFYTAWYYINTYAKYGYPDNGFVGEYTSHVYSVLLEHMGVCHDYSHTLYLMLRCLDVPVLEIGGTMNGDFHDWNMVQLGGQWYHTDVSPGSTYFLTTDAVMRYNDNPRTWGSDAPVSATGGISHEEFRQRTDIFETEGDFVYAPGKGILMDYTGSAESITVPEHVFALGDDCFRDCSAGQILLPDGLGSIGGSAFFGCSNLTQMTIPDSVLFIGEYFLRNTAITEMTFPSAVLHYDCCFSGMPELEKVVLPEGLTHISPAMFSNCTKLTWGGIDFPSTLRSIGGLAFSNCPSITKADFSSLPNLGIGVGVFSDCTNLKEVHLPDGMTMLPNGTFGRCTSLEQIDLPDSLLYIGSAFGECTALREITIPEGVLHLSGTFDSCSSLTSITVPNTVTGIGFFTFNRCSSLTELVIPPSVTSIDTSILSYSDKPTIVCKQGSEAERFAQTNELPIRYDDTLTTAEADDLVFVDIQQYRNNTYICDSSGATLQYCPTNLAIDEDGTMIFPDVVRTYSAGRLSGIYPVVAFDEEFEVDIPLFAEVTGVKLPEFLTKVPGNSFSSSKIEHVELGPCLIELGPAAFYGSSITQIDLPESLAIIGANAFAYTDLTSVDIPDSVVSIGEAAFDNCPMTEATIGSGVTKIGDLAFRSSSDEKLFVRFTGDAPDLLHDGTTDGVFSQFNAYIIHPTDALGYGDPDYQPYFRGIYEEGAPFIPMLQGSTRSNGSARFELRYQWLTDTRPFNFARILVGIFDENGRMRASRLTGFDWGQEYPSYFSVENLPEKYEVRLFFVNDQKSLVPLGIAPHSHGFGS